jgi:hypothetical protein
VQFQAKRAPCSPLLGEKKIDFQFSFFVAVKKPILTLLLFLQISVEECPPRAFRVRPGLVPIRDGSNLGGSKLVDECGEPEATHLWVTAGTS